jgi:predicted Rossmann fold flavoprotein
VSAISEQDIIYCIHTESHSFLTRKIVIATGGCSYPTTGSDGGLFEVLQRDLGIAVSPLSPALVPVIPEEYPYEELAGISLPHVRVSIHRDGQKSVHREGALLFTHGAFSGPCALDISSHAARGSRIALSYIHPMTFDDAYAAIRAQGLRTGKAVAAAFALPKRLAALLVQRAADSPKRLAHLLTEDTFVVKDTEGFKTAMVTKGGAALPQVNMTTMELKDHPGIYIIGEALDADAISGGYNLQLCWSTAQAAAFAAAAEVR